MTEIINESDLDSNKLTLIKFGAAWCKPCKLYEPTLKKLEEEYSWINFVSVDIDDMPELTKKYEIKAVPTLLIIKNNKELTRATGLQLIKPLRTLLNSLKD